MANNIQLETVALNEKKDAVVIIDQTLLPGSIEFKELRTGEEIYEAIYKLRVRGAPAIGVCAALGIYVIVNSLSFEEDTQENSGENYEELYSFFSKEKAYIDSSRPTAVNLSWALKRMERKLLSLRGKSLTMAEVKSALLSEAEKIREEDIKVCRSIGENALSLLKPGDGIITHCNAGALATVKYGTATSALYLGLERGYNFKVYCDETRPLLQGARLTAFELSNAGLDVTVLCDNMSSSLMKTGKINAAIVGCDRVTENGDTANKIGTSLLALAAKHYGVPFYIAAPTSTIDISLRSGDEIPIEHRADDEVTEMWYKKRMAPENIKVYNPAFDVTDHSLITAIITERGVVYPGEDGDFHLKKLFE